MQEIIKSRRNVLCFYAKETRQQRCAIGLNFDEYDQRDGGVPFHILLDDEVSALSLTQGKKLKKTYKKSQIEENIIVIYSARSCKGWFDMSFELGRYADAISK